MRIIILSIFLFQLSSGFGQVINKKISSYTVDTSLNKTLSHVIDFESGCPYYKKGNIYFNVYVNHLIGNTISFTGCLLNQIEIDDCYGIFEYDGVLFLLKGERDPELFHQKEIDSINIAYTIKNGENENNYNLPPFSDWRYKYNLKKFELINCYKCFNHISIPTLVLNLPEYTIDLVFYKELQKVIAFEKKCKYYKQGETCFRLYIEKTKTGFNISISPKSLSLFNYTDCKGVFEYGKHKFMLFGENASEISHIQIKNTLSIKYKEYDYGVNVDDRYSTWNYDLIGNKLILKDCYLCPSAKNQTRPSIN